METNINFFDINSVAIIWASEAAGKIWNDLLKNIKNFRWKKAWVNPKWWSFDDITFYESIEKLPFTPDIAVITIPAKFVNQSLKECGEKWIKRVIIISAWFKEMWNIEWEEEMKSIAKKYGIRVLWPNCLGYIDAHKNLNLSFGWKEIISGNIAMISQSWAMAVALTDWANNMNLGFSKIISMWNKSDINENDLLKNLEDDEKTEVIVIYLESLENGRKFYEIARKLTKKKPIVLVKSWISKKWQAAASSHTWALSWENVVMETAFRDAWIHTTSALERFFLRSHAFSKTVWMEIPEELVIITNAWGPWVMATDHCEYNNVDLKIFSPEEQKILKTNMPEASSMNNPLDIIWDATSVRYKDILENITKLNEKVWIIVCLTPQASTDVEHVASKVINFEKEHPEYFMMVSFMWDKSVLWARRLLKQNDLMEYDYPKKWIRALRELIKQKRWEKRKSDVLDTKKFLKDVYKNLNISEKKIEGIKQDLSKQEKLCNTKLTSKIFKTFGVSFLEDKLAKNTSDVEKIFNESKHKLVAKISSPDIAHKTDCGWVIVWISTKENAINAYKDILKSVSSFHPNAEIYWVTFQEMCPKSKEVFIWLKRDISFWEILIVWMWWIFVNIYEDVYMKLAPVTKGQIREMFTHLKWYPILTWTRWDVSINFDSLVDIVFKIMSIFIAFPEIKEIDINPVFANEDDSIIVDAKLYL